MSSMEKFLIGSYAGSLKDRLRGFDFQGYKGRVPSHILGHSVDFKYTIKAIDEYLDEVDGREDKNFEWNKWNALSPQEKQDFEGCIEILKRQQSLLKSSGNEGLDSPARMNVATVAASTAVAPPSSDGVESTKKKKKDSNVPSQSASDPWPAEGIDTAGSDSDDSSKDDSDVESFDFIERSVKTDNRWTEEEDRKLEKAVKSFKKQGKRPKWNFISERTFKGERSPGAVMQRWKTHQPGIRCGNWQPCEDAVIIEMAKTAPSWAAVAAKLPGRNSTIVGLRYNSLKRRGIPTKGQARGKSKNHKKIPKIRWTEEEDEILHSNLEKAKSLEGSMQLQEVLPRRSFRAINHRALNFKLNKKLTGGPNNKQPLNAVENVPEVIELLDSDDDLEASFPFVKKETKTCGNPMVGFSASAKDQPCQSIGHLEADAVTSSVSNNSQEVGNAPAPEGIDAYQINLESTEPFLSE